MIRWLLIASLLVAACRSFGTEPEVSYEWEAPNIWVDWECDGSTLVVIDASPGTDASNVEDACVLPEASH